MTLLHVLLQEPIGYEGQVVESTIERAGLSVGITHCRREDVARHAPLLRDGCCLPVGNAAFLRACFVAAGLPEPAWSTFPRELATHMLQQPRRSVASRALSHRDTIFVKPIHGAPFKGFILHKDRNRIDGRGRTQLEKLLNLSPTTPVWIAAALNLVSEWRYYVVGGDLIGYARLKPAEQSAMEPPGAEDISAAIAAIPADAAYAIDFGVLDAGTTTVLSVRDAWALPLTPHGPDTPRPLDFLRMLWMRWKSIVEASQEDATTEAQM